MNRLLSAPPRIDVQNIHLVTSEISARIVKASAEVLDDEIVQSLRMVLQPLRIDRGGLLEVLEGLPVVRVSHVWYDEGIGQVPSEINLAEWFPWAYQQIVVDGRIMALARCESLPAEAAVDRQSFAALGNKSTLT